MSIKIKAKKDLIHNDGTTSFIKGNVYAILENVDPINVNARLMNWHTTNEQGERHQIGNWYKDFSIVK